MPNATDVPVIRLAGSPGAMGFDYGRVWRDMIRSVGPSYVERVKAVRAVDDAMLDEQSARWLAALPVHFQEEMAGLAEGAGAALNFIRRFLFVDIASPSGHWAVGADCSGVVVRIGPSLWVGRNCDWLPETLLRGVNAVYRSRPGRIPSLSLGIAGDIDIDTGINAERLWLHVHTLHAQDRAPDGAPVISWLFWMRDCLETCASLAEVEAFIARTARDRGVILVAADGKTGEAAAFECSRANHVRIDLADDDHALAPRGCLVATNHARSKHPEETPAEKASRAADRAGTTIRRFNRLLELLREGPPEHGPDDLIDLLSDSGVEMRRSPTLQTIYSAVCDAATGRVWFAGGDCPAASGTWRRIPPRSGGSPPVE